MKKIFSFFLFISIFQFGFSQEETKNLTVREVTKMAVFSGCESFTEKTDLTKCLSNNLSNQLGGKLSDFVDEMQRSKVDSAVARIQFVISKDGKIIQIQALNGSDEKLGEASVKAFKEISEQTPKIEPAMIDGDIPVNMIFQIPISFKLEVPETVEPIVEKSEKEVKQIPIFPGCESYTRKVDLTKCMSNKLNELLLNELTIDIKRLKHKAIESANVRVGFVVNNNGRIVNIEILKSDNEAFSKIILNAFEKVTKKTPKIQPAILEDGLEVSMKFQLPVKF